MLIWYAGTMMSTVVTAVVLLALSTPVLGQEETLLDRARRLLGDVPRQATGRVVMAGGSRDL